MGCREMFGLDNVSLFVGFTAGVVLWGGLSFFIEWITRLIKARNTPDYPAEIARLNGRILQLESAVNDAANGAHHDLYELQAQNEALRAELAQREQADADTDHLLDRASGTEAALGQMTARAERAEALVEEAKVTLIAAEKALRELEQKNRESLLEIQERSSMFLDSGAAYAPAAQDDEPAEAYEEYEDEADADNARV